MRTTLRTAAATSLIALSVLAPGLAAPRPASAATVTARSAPVVDVPISFTVRNVNRSLVPCKSDGKTYTVRGHLVGPADQVFARRIATTTLYLHGLSFGQFFWDYQQARGYDYAAKQARRGQVSAVVDGIGYASSDKLNGNRVCVGSRADMTHQMVQALHSGRYQLDLRGRAPRSSHVVLAGHSYGGQIAEVEAYSFGDINALIVAGYADGVQSDLLQHKADYTERVCELGGLRVGGVGPYGYAPFGAPGKAPQALFYSAVTQVQQAVDQLLMLDPCGDTASFQRATTIDLAQVPSIKVPVLIVTGGRDALFPRPAGKNQAKLFTGSRRVSQVTLPNTGHALTFERTHNRFARTVDDWLRTLN